jgi:hypothetical protein
MPSYKYLIVGGGMTADAAVRRIREVDRNASIGLIGTEIDPPYDRPPLSKGLWKGKPLAKSHPNLAEVYRQKVAELHAALEDETLRDEGFELIRSLIEKVVVTPVEGELQIDLHGEFAGIFTLCQPGRRADGRVGADLASQIKVIAGARNHRDFGLPPRPI